MQHQDSGGALPLASRMALQLEKEGNEVGVCVGEGGHSCCGQLAGVSVGFAERSELVMGYIGREKCISCCGLHGPFRLLVKASWTGQSMKQLISQLSAGFLVQGQGTYRFGV